MPLRRSVATNMPLRRSPRLAAKANAKAVAKPLRRVATNSAQQNLRRSPHLEAAKAKARADIEARTRARVAQLCPAKAKADIITTVRALLKVCDQVHGRKAKAAAATTLMHYVATNGLPLVHRYERFRNVVVCKAYELKRDSQLHGDDHPEMVAACNHLLHALGEPPVQQLRPERMDALALTKLIHQLENFRERA